MSEREMNNQIQKDDIYNQNERDKMLKRLIEIEINDDPNDDAERHQLAWIIDNEQTKIEDSERLLQEQYIANNEHR